MNTTVNQNDEIYEEVRKAYNIIERVDQVILHNLIKSQHVSEDFKQNKKIFNALLNVIRAMDTLIYEL